MEKRERGEGEIAEKVRDGGWGWGKGGAGRWRGKGGWKVRAGWARGGGGVACIEEIESPRQVIQGNSFVSRGTLAVTEVRF